MAEGVSISELSLTLIRSLRDAARAAKRSYLAAVQRGGGFVKRSAEYAGSLVGSVLYRCQGRRPHAVGYGPYRTQFVSQHICNTQWMDAFQRETGLPEGYGVRLDERVVEFPWVISKLNTLTSPSRLLDAGSTLNHRMIMHHPVVKRHDWTILTLAPETECFWSEKVSYVFDDLRSMPFRDDWFDAVFCISVIEHVGMDNVLYTTEGRFREDNKFDYLKAVTEMRRVLRPGGCLYLTVPFGCYEGHGWLQQFDSSMLESTVSHFAPRSIRKTFFRYTVQGWNFASEQNCQGLRYFHLDADRFAKGQRTRHYDPDFAAAARAVACLELEK